MRLLTTGCAGFLGSHAAEAILARGDSLLDVDVLTYAADPERHKGQKGYERLVLDCRALHPDRIRKKGPFDAAIHLAAESHVDNSLGKAFEAMDTNIGGSVRFLEVCRALEIPRVLIMSTDEVCGDRGLWKSAMDASDERSPIRPSSPYSVSKASSELAALAWHRSFGLPVLVARCTNGYGPRQHPEKFIPRCATYILSGKAAPLYGDGRHVRDWIHAGDFATALLAILDRGAIGEVYCIGARCAVNNSYVVSEIARHLGGFFESVPDRPGHDLRYETNPSKIESLGWRAKTPFADGLAETLDWYKGNEAWWRAAIRRGGRWG